MTDTLSTTLAQDYAAALDWWREAGVDFDYAEEPQGWLTTPEVEAEAPPSPPPRTLPRKPLRDVAPERPPLGGDRSGWPADLAAFRDFWMVESSLDDGPVRDRVAPVGPASAQLMILLSMPVEGEDERLLARILAAMGQSGETTYRATLLVRAMPHPDWEGLAGRGLRDLTRHHIALAAPQRIVTFGKAAAAFAEGSGIRTLAAPPLDALARVAGHKRRFWNAWLEFSA